MKKSNLLAIALILVGCAQGRIDILDQEGQVVGYCSAEFKFHWHGAEHSVNYLLYLCAKEHLANGYELSDPSIFKHDYRLPSAPEGTSWNKKLAREQFSEGHLTEEKLGYLLAELETRYWIKLENAKAQLASSAITETEYERLIKLAETEFEGP